MAELGAQRGRLLFCCQIHVILGTHGRQAQHYFRLPTDTSDGLNFPTCAALDDISFSCKSCCWSYRRLAPRQHTRPSEYLKIGSLKFALVEG